MNMEHNFKVRGFFRLTARKADTLEVTRDSGWFENLILDTGLEQMGVGAYGTCCQVGVGNTPPAVSQTTLVAPLALTFTQIANTNNRRSTPPYYGWHRRTFRFSAGQAAGNIAEIGIGWGTGPSTLSGLFSRALVLDVNGNPTTMLILADELLEIVYELRLYPDLTDKVFSTEISGVEYDCVLRAASVASNEYWSPFLDGQVQAPGFPDPIAYNGAIGTFLSSPSGLSSPGAASNIGYVPGSLEKKIRAVWSVDRGNLAGGITAILYHVSNAGVWQQSFSPSINKNTFNTLTLNHKVTWSRYTP